jgi:hypothetical protein
MSEQVGKDQLENAQKLLKKIIRRIKQKSLDIEKATVLVSFGGGKDSAWVLAFIRLVQLLCLKEYGKTFNLKIITMINNMPEAVLDNIHSIYNRLGVYSDEKISADIFCYGDIVSFDNSYKAPNHIKKLFREDVLISGHRSQGDPRATFCYCCNLYMLNSIASELNNDIHFVTTGDSKEELKDFIAWLSDIFTNTQLEPLNEMASFNQLAAQLSIFNHKFFSDLYPDCELPVHLRIVPCWEKKPFENSWITVFDFTKYDCGSHWDFLTKFLGFKFADDSFNFTETDCIYPLLMGHLRGLSAEIEGRGYEKGIIEYLEFAKKLMTEKMFPENLIVSGLNRYQTTKNIETMRDKAQRCAYDLLQISEQQLKCMIHSPIADNGRNLRKYLEETSPELVPKIQILYDFLNGNDSVDTDLKEFLENRTGLNTQQLRHLYRSPLMVPEILDNKQTVRCSKNIFEMFRKNDPNKKEIAYTNSQGKTVHEIIGGR